jgi:hypothetical protein
MSLSPDDMRRLHYLQGVWGTLKHKHLPEILSLVDTEKQPELLHQILTIFAQNEKIIPEGVIQEIYLTIATAVATSARDNWDNDHPTNP